VLSGGVFYIHDGTCGGYEPDNQAAPRRCLQRVVAAGLVDRLESRRPAVWLSFACAGHVGNLIAARPLLDRDRAEMARRRFHHDAMRIDPDRGPLATGRAARELLARAQRWATAHPEQTYPPATATGPMPS